MSKIIDLFSGKPPAYTKTVTVTINNKDIETKIKPGNIYMNQYIIVAMIQVANDTVARTYELKLRKL